jgi:hypothetical protein
VPAGAASVIVIDALAPGASDTDAAGENDAVHPVGTDAVAVNNDAAHVEPLLFLSVTVYFIEPLAASETPGV